MIPSVDRHVGVNLSFQKESDCTVTLKGCIGDRPFEYSLPVRFDVTTTDIAPVHRLAAKRWIKELSDEENHGWFYQLLFDIILKPEHISGLAYFIHRALQTNLIPPAPNRICHRLPPGMLYVSCYRRPALLTVFRSNSKFDQNVPCFGLKCNLPITPKFCIRHDSGNVVTCANVLYLWSVEYVFNWSTPNFDPISNSSVGRAVGSNLYCV